MRSIERKYSNIVGKHSIMGTVLRAPTIGGITRPLSCCNELPNRPILGSKYLSQMLLYKGISVRKWESNTKFMGVFPQNIFNSQIIVCLIYTADNIDICWYHMETGWSEYIILFVVSTPPWPLSWLFHCQSSSPACRPSCSLRTCARLSARV